MGILNIFRLIYLLGAVNALFFSVLIFSKKKKSIADKILGMWLLVLSIQLIIPFLYLADLSIYYKYAGYEIVFFVFHPVLLNFYVRLMTGQRPGLRNIILSLIPIVIAEITGLSFFLFPAEERLNFIEAKTLIPGIYYPFILYMIIYFYYYVFISYRRLKKYRDSVLQIYSYKENVDLLWLRRLVLLFTIITIIIFPVGLVSYFYFHSIVFADYFFYVALVIFIFLLGYWGYQQGAIFTTFNPIILSELKTAAKVSPNPEEIDKLIKQKAGELINLMDISKPYLNPKLTIQDLATEINMPSHQLSRVINTEFHCNFFEFINSYRIEEFKRIALSLGSRKFTILAMAFDCGFNSKSAFNRIFKEYTGTTPGDFMKQQSK